MKLLRILFLILAFTNACASQNNEWYYSANICQEQLWKDIHDLVNKKAFEKFDAGFFLESDILTIELKIKDNKLSSFSLESFGKKPETAKLFTEIFDTFFQKKPKLCFSEERQFIVIKYINLYDRKLREDDIINIQKQLVDKGLVWDKMIFLASSPKKK